MEKEQLSHQGEVLGRLEEQDKAIVPPHAFLYSGSYFLKENMGTIKNQRVTAKEDNAKLGTADWLANLV